MTITKDTTPAPAAQVKHKFLATALAHAQLQMGPALKSANNPHFKTKYADLSSVMEACMPALNANGIAVIQPTTDDETGRYVETVLIHGESGETLKCRVPLIVSKNDMQGYGSAVTYARRYGLMSMAGIAPEDDDGNAAAKAPPEKEQPKEKPAPKAPAFTDEEIQDACDYLTDAQSLDALKACWGLLDAEMRKVPMVEAAKDARKDALSAPQSTKSAIDLDGDSIPD